MNFEYRLTRALAESIRRPQTGPYYWLPTPEGSWELSSYFNNDTGNMDHPDIWAEGVAPILCERWGIMDMLSRVARYPYGLPRGRVAIFAGVANLNHGNDSPVDNWVPMVCREYYLGGVLRAHPEKIRPIYDGHERMQAKDQSELRAALSFARSKISNTGHLASA